MNEVTPSEYLMMEVLAARFRCGEGYWTFPKTHTQTARKLENRGLVSWKSGIAEGTIRVWLSHKGRQEWGLYKPYKYPLDDYGWPVGAFR